MKNNQKVLTVSGLLLFFIILLVVFLLTGAEFSSGMWIILSFIILFACAALFFAIYFNRKITHKINNLNDDYRKVFFNIQDLITIHFKSLKKQKEVQDSIIEIFEHAQLENRDVKDVINNNVEGFVKEFLGDQSSKFNILSMGLYSCSLFIFFLIFMKVYKVVRVGSFSLDNFKTETLDLGITLTYLIIAFIFYPLLMWTIHYSAKNQFEGFKKAIIIIPAIIPLLLMSGLIFINNDSFRTFLDTETAIFSSIYAFILGVMIMLITGALSIFTKE